MLVAMTALVLAHPVTPILVLPGVFSAIALVRRNGSTATLITAALIVVLASGWLIYQADWVLTSGLRLLEEILAQERRLPFGSLGSFNAAEDAAYLQYVAANRTLYIAVFVVLVVSMLLVWREKTARISAIWIGLLMPSIVAALGAGNFADRGLLFALVPAAVIFGQAQTVLDSWSGRLHRPVLTILCHRPRWTRESSRQRPQTSPLRRTTVRRAARSPQFQSPPLGPAR